MRRGGALTLIAELGSSHNGSVGEACALMSAMCRGTPFDAAKTQDHRWQSVPRDAPHPSWMQIPGSETRAEYVKRLLWSERDWLHFAAHVRGCARQHIVSPFSVESLAWHLDHKTIDGIKIASGMVTCKPLLQMAAASGLAVFISTGMTTRAEDLDALTIVPTAVPMLCVSKYPCPPSDVNLNRRPARGAWGFSNHCLEIGPALGAIALGASVVEIHVGWDRRAYGSDAAHSLTIDEFARFCTEARALETALGSTVDKDALAMQLSATRRDFLHVSSGSKDDAGYHSDSVGGDGV